MATIRSNVLRLPEPEQEQLPSPANIDVPGDTSSGVSLKDGVLHVEHPDGSVEVDFDPDLSEPDKGTQGFYDNLAKKIDPGKLAEIAQQLIDGVRRDEESRKEWLEMRSRGVGLLGLKLDEPRGDLGTSSAPLEGMSSVNHPLLLEATVRFQATARGELLPASGPVKVRNDTPIAPKPAPTPPTQPAPQPQGQPFPAPMPPPPQQETASDVEDLADALEKDMNFYLTVSAPEYVPDTDRMLFYVGFGGDGFKKVYNCPLRRRPVSETVDAEDLIVSNASTDLRNCTRVTHRIKMRRSILRRLQIVGSYRDVDLRPPVPETPNPVDQKKQDIQGTHPNTQKPEDQDFTIFECYCELELDEYAPSQFKDKGLPLPYRVTIEKDSRQVLSVIRNWDEHDKEALPKQFFVQFPFIRGLGFYGLGLIHLLGNITRTLTATWREMVDAGMFASFPGFLYAKGVGRQLTNQFRVPPGGGIGLDLGGLQDIRSAIMPLPYKEPGPAFTAFTQHVEEVGQRLGQTADISVGEGKQEAPVGTTLALIEQATKIMDSVHKRLHASQAEEFRLLKERFQEDPEAFWRHNRRPTVQWQKDQFLRALDNYQLVPVADPNNPTSLHRVAKAMGLQELNKAYPLLFNQQAVLMRILRIVGIDPEGLLNAQPVPPPPDPRMEAIKAKAQQAQGQQQLEQQDMMIRAKTTLAQLQDKAADRQSREKLEQMKIALEGVKLQEERMIHAHELQRDDASAQAEIQHDQHAKANEMQMDLVQRLHELQMSGAEHGQELQKQQMTHEQELQRDATQHQQSMTAQQQSHEQKMQHADELNKAKVEQAKAMAKAKPKHTGGSK